MPPILCPHCRRLISSDEPRCPHCGLHAPGMRFRRALLGWLQPGPRDLVRGLITVNVAWFGLSLLVDPAGLGGSLNPLAFLSPSDRGLFLMGATGSLPVLRLGRWWTLLAANFLHGGLLHLFFNMAALAQIGPFVAREYGTARFVALYLITGAAGFLVSVLAGVGLTIGASASLLGLIGAAMYYGRARGGVYGQAVFRQMGGWTVGIFLFGFLLPGINNWAHGGGLAAGFVLGHLLGFRELRPEAPWHRLLALALAGLTALSLLWGLVGALAWRLGG